MLYPKPAKAEFFAETYQVKGSYNKDTLVVFFNRIKNGNEDVTVTIAPLMEKEAYTLTINEKGALIAASCEEGIYRAATSLLQLIKKQKGNICYAQIEDKPQLPHRGYMLDISRSRVPKMETIKYMVDFLSGLKYNEFQLYMEGECFKYSAYPEPTANFDCLTPEDIEELDRYCKERFMDLIPNQNSFGHLTPWLKHEQFKHLGLYEGDMNPDTINPLLDESLEFMDNVYGSLLPHFTSQYVNIGLDEAYGLGRFQMEEYCKTHDKGEVFMDWLNKLNDLANNKYGKQVQFWSDMIYNHKELYDRIPKNATVLEWGYDLIETQLMTEHCIMFQNAGLNYYVCPSNNTYLSFTGRTDVSNFNIRTAAELAVKYGASGLLLTDWGNGRHPHFHVWSLLHCALAGQYAWNVGGGQRGSNFKWPLIEGAEAYVDDYAFGGAPVSRILYRLGNYYLLEPERVHNGTMCGQFLWYPISKTSYFGAYDLKDRGDVFSFDNVSKYVTKLVGDIEKLEFDAQMKREILLNSRMAIFSAELCKIRVGYEPSNEEIDALVAMYDYIVAEFYELWCLRNYERGVESFLSRIECHRADLLALKK